MSLDESQNSAVVIAEHQQDAEEPKENEHVARFNDEWSEQVKNLEEAEGLLAELKRLCAIARNREVDLTCGEKLWALVFAMRSVQSKTIERSVEKRHDHNGQVNTLYMWAGLCLQTRDVMQRTMQKTDERLDFKCAERIISIGTEFKALQNAA